MKMKSQVGKLVFVTFVSGITSTLAVISLLTMGSEGGLVQSTQAKGIVLAVSLTIAIVTSLKSKELSDSVVQ